MNLPRALVTQYNNYLLLWKCSILPMQTASAQFPFSACYPCEGSAVPRSNNELGKASPLLPKLICHEMCLVGLEEDSAVCLTATLAAGHLQAGHRSHSPLQPLPPASTFGNISLNSLTCFPSELEGGSFFQIGFSFEVDQTLFCLFQVVVTQR